MRRVYAALPVAYCARTIQTPNLPGTDLSRTIERSQVKRCKDLGKYLWKRRFQSLRLDHTAMDGEYSYTLGQLLAVRKTLSGSTRQSSHVHAVIGRLSYNRGFHLWRYETLHATKLLFSFRKMASWSMVVMLRWAQVVERSHISIIIT